MKHHKISTIIASCLIMLLAIGCETAQKAAPDTRAEDEAAIRAADMAWSESAVNKDMEVFYSYLLDDAKMMAPDLPQADGKEAVRAMVEEIFAMPGFAVKWQPVSVTVSSSGDLGYSIGTDEMTFNGPDGQPVVEKGKYMTIWKKQADGSWKVAVDMFNSSMSME
jgi:ketosteroid isomerase-like protein